MTEQHANIALSEDSGQQECVSLVLHAKSKHHEKKEGRP